MNYILLKYLLYIFTATFYAALGPYIKYPCVNLRYMIYPENYGHSSHLIVALVDWQQSILPISFRYTSLAYMIAPVPVK